jgi:hypothetical protein
MARQSGRGRAFVTGADVEHATCSVSVADLLLIGPMSDVSTSERARRAMNHTRYASSKTQLVCSTSSMQADYGHQRSDRTMVAAIARGAATPPCPQ